VITVFRRVGDQLGAGRFGFVLPPAVVRRLALPGVEAAVG
jgi:hypothetical protein